MDEFRNYEYEEEIDLKQLLVFVFRKWRTMLAAAVVLGLLLGGAKAAKGFIDLQDPEKVEESIKESELALQNYETAKNQLTNQMAEYNRQIDDYKKYQDNSLYMKIDPYAVYKESITYVVTTDYQIQPGMNFQTPNWMGPVLSAYTTVANSVTLKDLSIEGRAGLSEEWDADSLEKLVKVETNANDGRLTITASAESESRAKAILQAVRQKVEENQKNVAEAAGEHKLSLISEKSTITVDQGIINDREARLRNVTALREAADKAVEKYEKLKEPKDNSLSVKSTIKGGIKFAILGCAAGIFLCCFAYAMQFLMNGKLNDIGSLKDRYRTRILAVLPKEGKNSLIDKILDRIEGIKENGHAAETLLHIAGASLGGTVNTSVAVAGTVSEETRKQIVEKLNQNESVTFCDAGDILADPEAVRKAKTADSVILVEEKNVSSVSDIELEAELLKNMGVRLEGFIIA